MIIDNLGLDPITYSESDLAAIKDTRRYRDDLYAMPAKQRRKYLSESENKRGDAIFALIVGITALALANA